ncbi:MAG: hypothetical protein K9M36_01690 [Candidatus Pacebacteria bacterium]|nr:hypothetical protein [Candidatus Paceibacterota bacterium]
MKDLLEKIELINQQTIGWEACSVPSGNFARTRNGIVNTMWTVNKFYGDPTGSFLDHDKKDPDPSIGYVDILLLSEIIAMDSSSFYWEIKEHNKKKICRLFYLESLVPEIREKKTVILFQEEHLRPDGKQESLRLLEELCSDPENEARKQYWEDVPDSVYCLKD